MGHTYRWSQCLHIFININKHYGFVEAECKKERKKDTERDTNVKKKIKFAEVTTTEAKTIRFSESDRENRR